MALEFGVLLPTREAVMSKRPDTAWLLEIAERAETLGFDSVWIGDSPVAKPRHEPLTLLAAVAARTKRVRLGTSVLLPALRQPVLLAQVVATLDRLSEGRLILGVGISRDVPPSRTEFAAFGIPWDKRVGRYLETLEICRALWTRDGVSFKGNHFTIDNVTLEPKPHRAGGPPIWIGGNGPTALRDAARFDGWLMTGPNAEFFGENLPKIRAAAVAAGRAADSVAGAAYLTVALNENADAARNELLAFLQNYYGSQAKEVLGHQVNYAGPADGCVEWLRKWTNAGAHHIILRFGGADQLAQLQQAASNVLPKLKVSR
jgi:probable F420-dependent oxidoreductase